MCAAAIAVLAAGCARVERAPSEAAQQERARVWPPPPEPARIAFERSVLRPLDLGLKRSPFTRIGQWLTGSDKGNEALIKPFGVALDEEGNLCVTDTGANAVGFYDRTTKKWLRWTRVGQVRFRSPVAVARRGGVFYVADAELGGVVAFRESGRLLFISTNGIGRPSGVCVDGEHIYVADVREHRIAVLDAAGQLVRHLGKRGAGPGEFNFPTHVSLDQNGNLLVTDSMNGRIQRLGRGGEFLGQLGEMGDGPGQFSRPKGVAADPRGNVYVIDALFDNVQIFDGSGRLLLHFGSAGSGSGEFWLPNGLAISSDNTIYVADSYNHRIQVFKYVGPS